jgi:hypothetical protein
MTSELIAIFGTLGRVIVTTIANYFSNRGVKNHEWRLALAKEQLVIRQKLYSSFLSEVQRLAVGGIEKKLSSISELDDLGGKIAEMSLIAPDRIMSEASKLVDYVVYIHRESTVNEPRDFYVMKKIFIQIARQDMEEILSNA